MVFGDGRGMINRSILHIDFNSYFATVEQQANPRLRGKPIGVTGGDRMKRTVLGAASVEAKKFGVKTGMQIWEAKKLCPQIILVSGDSDKYLECTKRFLNILKDYSPNLEVFSIDECFLELPSNVIARSAAMTEYAVRVAQSIKNRIKVEVGDWITCSIGISYNRILAKLAGSLYKPDGLVIIADQEAARWILDRVELDEICGIGSKVKKRLFNMGVTNFKSLRKVPKECLLASFKSYGEVLYNMARGIDHSPVKPFFEKGEVKSIGHRYTLDHDSDDPEEIKQILLKMSEMIAKRLRDKKLLGKTVHCWWRYSFEFPYTDFDSAGIQTTINCSQDGLDIFKAAWRVFNQLWSARNARKIRMVGASISNLEPAKGANLSFLPEEKQKTVINCTLDKINNKFGDFTLQRGVLLTSAEMKRKPNPYLADRRFKI